MCYEREFCPTFDNLQCQKDLQFLEHDMEVFDFDQKWLYQNEPHGKHLKAPKMVISKVPQGVHFYINLTTSTQILQYWVPNTT